MPVGQFMFEYATVFAKQKKDIEKDQPAPTGDQYYKSQVSQQGGLIRATSNQTDQSSKISDSERKPRFMDELDRLNADQKYTKQDIIDYVKSRVKIKTT